MQALHDRGSEMSQYRDEKQAAVRAINSGEGRPKTAAWQRQYTAGYRVSSPDDCELLAGVERLLADATTHATMRRFLTARQYNALVVRYSGNSRDQIEALKALAATVGTNAGPNCKALAVGSWAMPAYKSEASANWDQQDVTDRTLRQWRRDIHKELQKLHDEAFVILAEVFKELGKIGA